MLLTRAPVAGGSIATPPMPLDLHVLGLSLAFILSQDQTLRCCILFSCFYIFYDTFNQFDTTRRLSPGLLCALFIVSFYKPVVLVDGD